MRPEIAQMVKERVTTRDLCRVLGVRLNKNGFAICPFHADKRYPSLKVYDDPARGWVCFGCHAGGSVIDFAMRWHGIEYEQAIVRLDADFALNLPLTYQPTAAERRKSREDARKRAQERERERLERAAAEAAYWGAYERYLTLVRRIDEYRPKKPGEAIDVRYSAALHLLPEIRDEYERAQDAWLQKGDVNSVHGRQSAPGGTNQTMDTRGLPKRCAI